MNIIHLQLWKGSLVACPSKIEDPSPKKVKIQIHFHTKAKISFPRDENVLPP